MIMWMLFDPTSIAASRNEPFSDGAEAARTWDVVAELTMRDIICDL
jgi:hypothetical protein